jgi:tetratricopeptide (TPR) repeat protein
MLNEAKQLFEEGKYQEASQIFESLLAKKERNPLINFNLGICYLELSKPKLALLKFQEALQMFSKLPNSTKHQVKALYYQHRAQIALNLMAEAEKSLLLAI